MPTVHCPSCHRALNLPRAIDVVTAQCPLCQTTFDVARQTEQPPRSTPLRPSVVRVDTASAKAPSPFDFERPSDPLDDDTRKAMASAASWLRWAGLLGLAHSLVCWCGTFASLDNSPYQFLLAGYCVGYVLNILVSLVVHNGARALTRRRDPFSARLSAVAAFLAALLEALFAAPTLLAFLEVVTRVRRRPGEDALLLLVFLGMHLVVFALYLTAGVKTILALQRPGVRRAFSR
jgi:hypothetical protein